MMSPFGFALILALLQLFQLPTSRWQPSLAKNSDVANQPISATKKKAVLLVHGLYLQILRPEKAGRPETQDWQKPRAPLIKELSPDFDVFTFAYAQTLPVDAVSLSWGLRAEVARLKKAGYEEIILIGHSAGGIVSRQFVERFPNTGVTKVIQVATPNDGSDYATIKLGIPKLQLPYLQSLAPESRQLAIARPRKLPEGIDFCCVVCKGGNRQSDTIVSFSSQWPVELQKQGVPAVLVPSYHNEAMKADAPVKAIGELAREKLARWTREEVEQGRKVLFEAQTSKGIFGLGLIK
jgi:pimeloyl-ACP methyl ester carboxylesterase